MNHWSLEAAGRPTLAVPFLLLLTVLCFAPGITPELSGDDFVHVFKNRQPFPSALKSFAEADGREYRPVVRLSLAIDHSIWGSSYAGFHISNLLFHLVTVFLVFRFAQALFDRPEPPLLAAGLFALHPVHSYSVNGIMGRTDLLCAVFLVSAALASLRGSATLTWLLFAGALLSKEVALAFPLVLLLWLPFRDREGRRTLFAPLAGSLVISFAYLAVRLTLLTPSESDLAVYLQFSVTQVIKNIVYYGGAVLIPAGQFELRSVAETEPLAAAAIALGTVAIVLALLWPIRRSLLRSPQVWMALVWSVSFLLPVLLLFQRRYLYIPSIGVSILIAWVLTHIPKKVGMLIGILMVAGFAGISLNAARTWREAGQLVGRNLEQLVPIVREHGSERIFVTNVLNGLGEAHLFTHDSLRFAIGLQTGSLPRMVTLTRIQLAPGSSWQTTVHDESITTKVIPGPETYFVFDAPEFLPRGGRFLPVGTEFTKSPFQIRVAETDQAGRVSELEVAWEELPAGSLLVVLKPDTAGPALISGADRSREREEPQAKLAPGGSRP